MDVRCHRTGRPAPPPLSPSSRCTAPPARGWAGRHPLGVVGEPAAGRIPSVPSVGGWSRLGPPPVSHAGFLGHLEAQKSVECIRCDFLRSGCD
jgi:hypothetical protein